MTFGVKISGHRGLGCTDSAFAIKNNFLKRPAENTLKSFTAAFGSSGKVDFIETDVIRTRDNRLVLCHSTALVDHVPKKFRPAGKSFIDELTFAQVRRLRCGPDGSGKIPSLQQLFALVKSKKPGKDMVLNLEIKDVQGTPCRGRKPYLAELVLKEIKAARFPLSRIRFSSFSLSTMAELARLEPKAKLGMLFDAPRKQGGSIGRPLFIDRKDKFLGFAPAAIMEALKRVPHLENLHPEIRSLTPQTVAFAAKHKLGITTWGLQEKSPLKEPEWAKAARQAVKLCRKYNVPLELITDHAADMRKYVAPLLKERI